MDSRSRAATSVFEGAATAPLSKTMRPLSGGDAAGNSAVAQVRASNETLASNEPPLDPTDANSKKTIYDFQVLSCYHELYDLTQHKGSVVLICNVASKDKEYTEAGYTILTKLYQKHRHEKFAVLAFPCNEFGNGEPGNEDEVAENISCVYPRIGEVDFPIMAKVEVNGDHASPLFTFLKSRIRGTLGQSSVKWNFTYFLCDATGVPYARFAPGSTLMDIEARVDELLHPAPPPAPTPSVEASAPLSGGSDAPLEDAPSPDESSGCATPPPSEVVHHSAAQTLSSSPAPPLASTMTVTDVTSRASPPVEDEGGPEERVSAGGNGSWSALFDKTTNTLEGASM